MPKIDADQIFRGDWRITSTEVWDRDTLDLVPPAFNKFEDEGMGEFLMTAIRVAKRFDEAKRRSRAARGR